MPESQSMKMSCMEMHNGHHSAMPMKQMGNLKQKFWVSLILALPVLFLTPIIVAVNAITLRIK